MYTTNQLNLLRELGPHYLQAIQQNRQRDFYEQAYARWFDHFPEPRGIDEGDDEYEWVLRVRKKVSPDFAMQALISHLILAYSKWTSMGCVAICSNKRTEWIVIDNSKTSGLSTHIKMHPNHFVAHRNPSRGNSTDALPIAI